MLYIDIDSSVLALTVVAFVWIYCISEHWRISIQIIALAVATLLMFWSKLTSPPFVLFACFLVGIMHQKWRHVIALTAAGALGLALFAITFWIYGFVTQVDLNLMWNMYGSKGSGYLLAWIHSPGSFLNSLKTNIAWTSPLFLGAIAYFAAQRLRLMRIAGDEQWIQDVLLMTGISTWLLYPLLLGTTHPKYIYPSVLLFAVFLAGQMVRAMDECKPATCLLWSLAWCLGMLFGATLPQAQMERPWPALRGHSFIDLLRQSELITLAGSCILIAVGFVFGWRNRVAGGTSHVTASALGGLLLAGILTGLLDLALVASSPYSFSPLNRKKEIGFAESAAAARQLQPDLLVVYSRAGALYRQGRYLEVSEGQDVYLRGWTRARIRQKGIDLLRAKAVDYVCDSVLFPECLLTEDDCRQAGMQIVRYGDFFVGSFRPLTELQNDPE